MWSCGFVRVFRTVKFGRGNTPIMKDRSKGNIGTANQSKTVTAHGIFDIIVN